MPKSWISVQMCSSLISFEFGTIKICNETHTRPRCCWSRCAATITIMTLIHIRPLHRNINILIVVASSSIVTAASSFVRHRLFLFRKANRIRWNCGFSIEFLRKYCLSTTQIMHQLERAHAYDVRVCVATFIAIVVVAGVDNMLNMLKSSVYVLLVSDCKQWVGVYVENNM